MVDLVKSLNTDFKYPSPSKQSFTSKDKSDRIKSTESASSDSSSNNIPTTHLNANNINTINSNNNNNNNYGIVSTIYWMLQDPIDESKYSFNKSTFELITNKQIDCYNRAAINLLYYSPIQVWSSSRLVSQAYNKDSLDGLKIGSFALNIVILFILKCWSNLFFIFLTRKFFKNSK